MDHPTLSTFTTFNALTQLVGQQEGHSDCKKLEWWCAGIVVCLQRGADLHMAQLMPLPLTVSCFTEIQIGFNFLVLAHPGSPRQRAVKCVWVCVCVMLRPYSHQIPDYPHLNVLVPDIIIKHAWNMTAFVILFRKLKRKWTGTMQQQSKPTVTVLTALFFSSHWW